MIWIVPVPEPKTLKNCMHLDVYGATQATLALGATLVLRARSSAYSSLARAKEADRHRANFPA